MEGGKEVKCSKGKQREEDKELSAPGGPRGAGGYIASSWRLGGLDVLKGLYGARMAIYQVLTKNEK